MPNRMLRDWTLSGRVNKLSASGERFFTRLIMKVDDYGVFFGDVSILRAFLFPLILEKVKESDVNIWLSECQQVGLVLKYNSAGKKYIQIMEFKQRLDRAKSRYPLPSDTDLQTFVNEFPPEVEVEKEVEVRKGIIQGGTSVPAPPANKKIVPPTAFEIQKYFIETIGNPKRPGYWPADRCHNEAQKMWLHYDSNGWKQGRGKPIVKWKSAAAGWITRALEGVFEKPKPTFIEKPMAAILPIKPMLNKLQTEVNFHYGRWVEDPKTVTSHTIEPAHYDEMKKAGIELGEKRKDAMLRQASEHCNFNNLDQTMANVNKYAKIFAVLEIFENFKKADKTQIFYVHGSTTEGNAAKGAN